jgi:hypothetical protein
MKIWNKAKDEWEKERKEEKMIERRKNVCCSRKSKQMFSSESVQRLLRGTA